MNKRTFLVWAAAIPVVLVLLVGCSGVMESVIGEQPPQQEQKKAATDAGSEADGPEHAEQSGEAGALEVTGTWVNTEYDGQNRSAMVVYKRRADGSFSYTAYDNSDGSGNVYKGTVRYQKTWTDDQGRRLGRSVVQLEGGMSWNTLDRISVDGSTLEVQSGVDQIDPNGPRYSIYYRQ
ncbi:MAG: hypothetical protein ACOC7U_06110 [Spirochaetota bacterium]